MCVFVITVCLDHDHEQGLNMALTAVQAGKALGEAFLFFLREAG